MKYIYRICVLFVFLFSAPSVFAGTLVFTPQSTSVNIGEQFYVDVFLSPENISWNGIEGSIKYSKDLLKFLYVEEGRSIVNAWIEKPHTSEEGLIYFAGIIPNGFMGVIDPFSNTGKTSPGRIMRLVFEARASGTSSLEIISPTGTENNGIGTLHSLGSSIQKITIKNVVGKTLYVSPTNTVPEIEAYITSDKDVFSGKYILIFNASDISSGIKEVLVKEGDREWKNVSASPYVLEDQSRRSRVVIQAVSFSDEKAFATIEPLPSPIFSVYNIIILFFGIAIILIALKYAHRKKLF